MTRSHHQTIRSWLRAVEDGASVSELAGVIGAPSTSVRAALKAMPDVYIDRWRATAHGQYEAVWCAVQVPEHCPRPDVEVAA